MRAKNWDAHVVPAEEVARSAGFQRIRDRILELAEPAATDHVVDIGAGTGLLTLAIAPRVAEVWAIDIADKMVDYVSAKAASAGLENVRSATASAVSLPLVDASADLVVSNYCLHHLADADKERALVEARRVLRPGGRLVLGDMMFGLSPGNVRDRRVVASKVSALFAKGPAGVLRLLKNTLRVASGRWEHPARPEWWRGALVRAGFVDVDVVALEHEGGIAYARVPSDDAQPSR